MKVILKMLCKGVGPGVQTRLEPSFPLDFQVRQYAGYKNIAKRVEHFSIAQQKGMDKNVDSYSAFFDSF